jgi:succinyl-CoA synthetase beta subunit
MTDLAEIATLLLAALDQVPELRAPVVARLIGNNLDQALQIISAANSPLVVETDLERAMDRTLEALARP